jgi:hypothetical protein
VKPSQTERRKELRSPASGELWLFVDGPGTLKIEGRLIDLSRHGFRVAHRYAGMAAGCEVRFRHTGGEGKALVVWNRILAGSVESGFLIL